MNTIKLHEQIAAFRKEKGMTQEELARSLGVTNQAVSKWESAQCCPDIQLLPRIAELFRISVDQLLGHNPSCAEKDLLPALREKIDALSEEEAFAFTFRTAATLHAMIWSKYMAKQPNAPPDLPPEALHSHEYAENRSGPISTDLPQ